MLRLLLPTGATGRPPLPSEEVYNDKVAAVDPVGEMVPVDELDLHDDFSQLMQCPITLVGLPSDWRIDRHVNLLAISELHICLQEVMQDPVVLLGDGNTYERCAIEKWLLKGTDTSPLTGEVLTEKRLVPNHLIRSFIAQAGFTLDSD